ncbi:MAG: carboxypeptidase-like regulatory domain-containing protein, partial [Anaerolineae bacterium]
MNISFARLPGLLALFFSAAAFSPAQAHVLSGTVEGPDGLMPGLEVLVRYPGGPDWVPTITDGSGRFSIDIPSDTVESILPNPSEASGLMGKKLDWFNISGGREIRLFVEHKVAFSVDLAFPGGIDPNNMEFWLVPADGFHPLFDWNRVSPTRVEGFVPAGAYIARVFPRCESNNLGFICPFAEYFSAIPFEAKAGQAAHVVMPLEDLSEPRITRTPPVASLLSVGPPDGGGIATVSGAPGATVGAASVTVVNLQTGHYKRTASRADGSFNVPFLAPPGTWLEVRHDPTGLSNGDAQGPGTIIRAPVPGEASGAFATMRRAYEWSGSQEGDGPVENFGVRDSGQLWLSGNLADRAWSPGETIALSGPLKVYSRDAGALDAGSLSGWGRVMLERVFDASGKQERANPVFMSSFMTPTGLPIERRGQNWSRGSTQAVQVGDMQVGGFTPSGPHSLDGTWSTELRIPDNLPGGVYSLVFEPNIPDITTADRYFEGAFPQLFDTIFSLGGAALVTVGSPPARRLGWVLGLNEFSDG